MEIQYLKRAQFMYKIYTLLFVLFCGYASQAQINQVAKDSIITGFSVGKIQIKDPKSILSSYAYDPKTDRYVYTNSIDGFPINYPTICRAKSLVWPTMAASR